MKDQGIRGLEIQGSLGNNREGVKDSYVQNTLYTILSELKMF